MGEIKEECVSPDKSEQEKQRQSKVPEAEIHLYRQGKGPMAVFKSALGDWEQDQLEFREDILEKHDMKLVFAFNPTFSRSVLTYRDVVVVYLDGEPKVCFVFYFLGFELFQISLIDSGLKIFGLVFSCAECFYVLYFDGFGFCCCFWY